MIMKEIVENTSKVKEFNCKEDGIIFYKDRVVIIKYEDL